MTADLTSRLNINAKHGVPRMVLDFKQFRSLNRDVKLHLLSRFFTGFGYAGIYMVLFNLYLLRLGYGPSFVGLTNGVGRLGGALFSIAGGALGTRFGSRRVAIIGITVASLCLMLVLGGEWFSGTTRQVWIVVAFSCVWMGGSTYLVNQTPLLTRLTTQEQRSYAFSALQATAIFGGFSGNLMGGFLPRVVVFIAGVPVDSPSAYRFPLLLGGLIVPGAGLMTLLTRNVAARGERSSADQNDPKPVGPIIMIAVVALLLNASMAAYGTFFAVYLDSVLLVATPLIGLLLALTKLLSVSTLITPMLIRRWGKSKTLLGAGIGISVSAMPIALFPHWLAAGASLLVQSIMSNFRIPAYLQLTQEHLKARWRGLVSGAVQTASGLSVFVVSLVGGFVVVSIGYPAMFVIASVFSGIGGLMVRLFLAESPANRS